MVQPAVRKARALIRRHQIPLVYTTALPYTSLRIGMSLQRLGVRWVADFRDPGSYAARMSSRIAHVYARQWSLEGEALKRADAVTVLSSMYPMILHDMHGFNGSTAIRFIPTGADDELVAGDVDVTENGRYIVFCGEFLAEYGGRFLELFARAIANDPHARSVKLLIVGRLEVNRRTLMPLIGALNLERHVEPLVDHLPQSSLYPLIRGAMAGVLVPGPRSNAPVEQLREDGRLHRAAEARPGSGAGPERGAGPAEGRRARRLSRWRHGRAGTAARGFSRRRVRLPVVNRDACARYLAARQVADFAEVFEWSGTASWRRGPRRASCLGGLNDATLRMLLFSYDYPPNDGGIARLCSEIAENGTTASAVCVLTQHPAGGNAKASHRMVERRVTSGRPWRELLAWRFLRRARAQGPVVCGIWYPEGLVATLARIRPRVILAHGTELLFTPPAWRREAWRRMRRHVLESADLVAANSEYTRELVEAAAPRARATSFRWGSMPCASARGASGSPPEARPRGQDGAVVRGEAAALQGHDLILQAMAASPPTNVSSSSCSVAGDGPELPRLQGLAAKLGIADLVRWLGFVPRTSSRTSIARRTSSSSVLRRIA